MPPPTPSMLHLRHKARQSYKQLLTLLPHYPTPSLLPPSKVRGCFASTNKRINALPEGSREQEDELAKAVAKAQWIRKEIEAVCFLGRYRELRRRYGDSRSRDDYS